MQYCGVQTALREGKAVVIDRTGGGKSHTIRLTGSMLRGLNIVFHPLLALLGDQVAKFSEGNNDYGAIETHNIDEIGTTSKTIKLIAACPSKLYKRTLNRSS